MVNDTNNLSYNSDLVNRRPHHNNFLIILILSLSFSAGLAAAWHLTVTPQKITIDNGQSVSFLANMIPTNSIRYPSYFFWNLGSSQINNCTDSNANSMFSTPCDVFPSSTTVITANAYYPSACPDKSHASSFSFNSIAHSYACSYLNSSTITVNPALRVSVSPALISTNLDKGFKFFTKVSGGTGPFSYQWYNYTTGIAVPINHATKLNYNSITEIGGNFTYYIVVTDKGAYSHPKVQSNLVVLSVNGIVTATITPPNSTIILGNSVSLIANIKGSNSDWNKLTWSFTSNNVTSPICTASTYSCTFTPQQNGTVTFSAIDYDNFLTVNATSIVTVNKPQYTAPNVSITPTLSSLPPDTNQTISISIAGGNGPFSIQWYNDTTGTGVIIPGQTSNSYLFQSELSGTYSYYANVTDLGINPNYTTRSQTSTMVVNGTIGVTLSPSTFTTDMGMNVTFDANVVTNDPVPSDFIYGWTDPISSIGTGGGNGKVVCKNSTTHCTFLSNSSGTATLNVTDIDDNLLGTAQASFVINPLLSIAISPNTATVNAIIDNLTFTNTTTGGTSPFTYSYSVAAPLLGIWTQTNNTFNFVTPGNYTITLEVTDSVGANAFSNATVSVNP
ncbi:MAG: hypothetical protein ACHQX1_01350 [Candidatus Micrarchaeales archaeon]